MTGYERSEYMAASITIAADPTEHVERFQELVELDFEEIMLHNVHRNQETIIGDVGSGVVAELER